MADPSEQEEFEFRYRLERENAARNGFDLSAFQKAAPQSQSILSTLPKYAPEAGSIAGGIAGGLVGGVPGAIGGTALGASIGTSLKQIYENLQGQQKEVTGKGGILHEQIENVAEQTAYEVAGQVIGKAIGKVFKSAAPTPRGGAETAQNILSAKGGGLSAAQAVDSPTLNIVESIARQGAGGKGRFLALEQNNAKALDAIKSDLLNSLGSGPANDRVAGKLFQDAITRGEAAHRIAASGLYAAFDQRAGGILVDAAPLQQYGRMLSDEFKRIGNVGKTDAGGQLVDQLTNVSNTLTLSDAHMLRSNLLSRVRDLKASSNPDSKAVAIATRAAQRVDEAMEAAVTNISPQLQREYRDVSRFYKSGKQAFDNDVVSSLLTKQPERVGEELFRAGNVSEIIQAKASLRHAMKHDPSINGQEVFQKLQAGYLNAKLTARGATDKVGETTAQNLLKDLAEAKTDRQFAVMFTPQQRQAINDFARTAYLTLNNKPHQFGVLVSMMQAAAIGDLALNVSGSGIGTSSPATDVAVLLGPTVLSRVLTNPRAVRLLSRGMELPDVSIGTAVTTKLIADFAKSMNEGYDASVER